MKLLLFLTLIFGACQVVRSQVIVNEVCIQADTTAQAKLLLRVLKARRDTLWYHNAPVYVTSNESVFTIGFGISEFYNKAALGLYRNTFSGNSPFNNKKNGVKDGIWFTYTLFRHLKTATEYDKGRVKTVIMFWADGLPKSIQNFNTAGRKVLGGGMRYEKINSFK